MSKQAAVKPETAYDYRRYIELVQVLANGKGILALCEAWDIKAVIVYPENNARSYYDMEATIKLLAQAAIEYHRNERD